MFDKNWGMRLWIGTSTFNSTSWNSPWMFLPLLGCLFGFNWKPLRLSSDFCKMLEEVERYRCCCGEEMQVEMPHLRKMWRPAIDTAILNGNYLQRCVCARPIAVKYNVYCELLRGATQNPAIDLSDIQRSSGSSFKLLSAAHHVKCTISRSKCVHDASEFPGLNLQ